MTTPETVQQPQQPGVRSYNLTFNRRWPAPLPPVPPGPLPPGPGALVPVIWDGYPLQEWNPRPAEGDWFTGVVETVTGWYASPPLNGHNIERALGDGAVLGTKRLGPRVVTINGAAVGPRDRLMDFRDHLAYLSGLRYPTELIIGDPWLGTALTTMVRADTDSFTHVFLAGNRAFRYTVSLTATDPLLYDTRWQQVTLTTRTAADAGRVYDRIYWNPRDDPPPDPLNGWVYGNPYPAGSAGYLSNAGNADAPVYAAYEGDLAESRLTDETRSILMDDIGAGVSMLVATASLAVEAPGGPSRAQWLLPGSRPMTIPPFSTARWHLYSVGSGQVTLSWRSAWL